MPTRFAELFEKRKELDNKDIVLKGKVVKVTARIMNKKLAAISRMGLEALKMEIMIWL